MVEGVGLWTEIERDECEPPGHISANIQAAIHLGCRDVPRRGPAAALRPEPGIAVVLQSNDKSRQKLRTRRHPSSCPGISSTLCLLLPAASKAQT